MKKLMMAVAFAGFSFALCGAPVLRVMPLGDSITNGSGSNDTAGYRGFLCAGRAASISPFSARPKSRRR